MPTGRLSRLIRLLIVLSLGGIAALTTPAVVSVRADDPPEAKDAAGASSKPVKSRKKSPTTRPARWKRDNAAGLPWRTGERPVQVWPPPKDRKPRPYRDPIVLGDWRYESRRASDLSNGVPWELIVTPAGEDGGGWISGGVTPPGAMDVRRFRHAREGAEIKAPTNDGPREDVIPIINLPEAAWRVRMSADLQGVVGIHFHEFVSDDVARILYTVHKVPPDPPEGAPNVEYAGKAGTRIEATLLAPVIWSLDQTIVVRVDNERTPAKDERDKQTAYRIQHEAGHSEVSQAVLLQVPAGPQNWNLQYCEGRRSRFVYYWKRELIGRSWDGYQNGIEKIATLRTSIAIVPPTRWSMLLPIPPSRVTQKHLQMFNDAIVLLGEQFAGVDHEAQERFHAHHGEYDQPVGP